MSFTLKKSSYKLWKSKGNFFNWDSLHARLKRHRVKRVKKEKNIKSKQEKVFRTNLNVKGVYSTEYVINSILKAV